MPKYRKNLPILTHDRFLSDGGLETTLIFHRQIDLPHFAAFPLLDTVEGRRELETYYDSYLSLAVRYGAGFVIDTPTWRANPDWAALLGYDRQALRHNLEAAAAFVISLRERWERATTPCVLSGLIGPRGDGYKAGKMTPDEAEDYHSFQIEVFSQTDLDMISGLTMNSPDEAIGIARAAKRFAMPSVIAFTVETDGRLANGQSLAEAIEQTDTATDGSPAYYMVNCAHPSHFAQILEPGTTWTNRLGGIRANASSKSHAELDDATMLDSGDLAELANWYREMTQACPNLKLLGGCCGTDHRHVQAICESCFA